MFNNVPGPPEISGPIVKRFEPVCQNALWRDKNERPLCNEVINLLCVSKDAQAPFFISLHGTQLKPVRAFLSALGLRKKSLYEFQATLGLKEKTNGKGKFFVIQFANRKREHAGRKGCLPGHVFPVRGPHHCSDRRCREEDEG